MVRSITSLLLLCFFYSYPQLKGYHNTGNQSFLADTLHGMYNGKCMLWDKNGKKRIEGYYTNNQKTGKWTVWDTIGNVRVRIKYKNNHHFTVLNLYDSEGRKLPRLSQTDFIIKRYTDSIEKANNRLRNQIASGREAANLFKEPEIVPRENFGYAEYILERDSSGVIIYPYVGDDDLVLSSRIFRFIEPSKTNTHLFENNNLLENIRSYITSTPSPEIYTTSDFLTKMDSIEALSKLIEVKTIAGYKIQEFFYFDKKHLSSSIRILAICPVVINFQGTKYEDLFWVYYPAIRETIAASKMSIKGSPEIMTLEDTFHFRRYNGFIYFREHVTEKEPEIDLFKNYRQLKKESVNFDEMLLYLDWVAWHLIH